MRRIGRLLFGALAIAGAAILVTAVLAARNPSPVLWSWAEEGHPTGEPALVIFNPFRDRSPEAVARRFLALTRAGQFEEALSEADLPADLSAEWVRAKQKHSVGSFRLANRRDLERGVELFYWKNRKNQKHASFPLWITVSRDKKGECWVVTDLGGWGW